MAGQREGGFTFDLGSPTPGAVQGEGDGSFDPSPSAPLGSDSDVGHLDLDLGDLGVAVRAGKTPAPASAASTAAEETKRPAGATPLSEAPLSEAPAPQRLFRRETRLGSTPWGAFSRKPEDASDATLDTAPLEAHAHAEPERAPLELAPAMPELAPLDLASSMPERAPLERAHAEPELAPVSPPRDAAPRVKKIVFPAPSPTTDTPAANALPVDAPTVNAPAAVAQAIEARAIDAPTADAQTTDATRAPQAEAAPSPLEPPLDLPDELRARSPALPEPPSPQALWRLTRDLWRSTTRQAASLGRASAARGLSLAEEAKGVWRRKRSVRSADPAISRAPLPGDPARSTAAASSVAGAASLSAARAVPLSAADAAPLSAARATSSSESVKAVAAHQATVSSTPERPRGPSPSGFGRRLLRQLAPPAATVSIAALVYVAGSHVLGTTDAVSLSRTTGVPHLGSLPSAEVNTTTSGSPAERKAAPATGSDKAAPTPRGPHVEKAPFPADLSYPGKGLIEVVTREDELIYVNGVFIGRGPLRRVPVNPGEHAVSIRSGGSEQKSDLRVESNATTRVSFVPAPSSSE